MDCLSLGEGENVLARCFSEFAYLDWHVWLVRSPLWIIALLVGAPLLICRLRRRWNKMRWKHDAHRRAEQLLRERLTLCEYKHLKKCGFIDIASRLDLHRYYRIPQHQGRIWVYEAFMLGDTSLWRKTAELCIVAMEEVPDADLVLSYKWLIEGDEASFLALANWIRMPETNWTLELAAPTAMQRDVQR